MTFIWAWFSFTQYDYYLISDQLLQWLGEANKRRHQKPGKQGGLVSVFWASVFGLAAKICQRKNTPASTPDHASEVCFWPGFFCLYFFFAYRLIYAFVYVSFICPPLHCRLQFTHDIIIDGHQKFGYKKPWSQMELGAVDFWINQRNHLPSSSNHEVPCPGEFFHLVPLKSTYYKERKGYQH